MDHHYLELFKQLIRLRTTHDAENMSEHDRCRDLLRVEAEKRGLKRNDIVWVESRRGKVKVLLETQGRNRPTKGYTFAPFFDESVFVNKVCIDMTCPMSKETDFKKAAVKVYKA